VTEVFRLANARFPDSLWSGDGGLHVDGRWHEQGRRIIYSAQSLSLAQLEVLVHIPNRQQAPQLIYAQAVLPETLQVQVTEIALLPGHWRQFSPYSEETQKIGMRWLAEAQSAVLKVPSAISEGEWNFLLNPAHPDFQKIQLGKPRAFTLDPRVL
jgi:RES domain-containing protein